MHAREKNCPEIPEKRKRVFRLCGIVFRLCGTVLYCTRGFSERRGGHLCVVRCRRRRRAAILGFACVVVVVRRSGVLDRGQVEVARISYVIRMTDQPTARGASQQANQQAQPGRVSQHGTTHTTTHAGLLASGDHRLYSAAQRAASDALTSLSKQTP